jgi:site-specific recombinase XerD
MSDAAAAVRDPILFGLVRDFFKEYLPKLSNRSPNTIYAYRESLDALLDFVKEENRVSLSGVTFEMIDRHALARFLDHLETARGCSVETRNHRLNRIRAFYKYAAKMEMTAVIHRDEILKVPLKKTTKPDIVTYMSEEAIKAVLAQPDASTVKGLRDLFLMVLLYDTAARIQELVDIRLCDIRLGGAPTATLHGKGGKTRVVPLMDGTVRHFSDYAAAFHPGEGPYSEQFLFYVLRKGRKSKMHHDTARRFISDYGAAAREVCPDVPENVHPHLFRHTRSMNLYQRGMDLPLVSQWLGHASLETTRRFYARADTEQKRLAIEKATDRSGPLAGKFNAERYTVSDDDLLKRLYGLK